jgi:hypothetical protein
MRMPEQRWVVPILGVAFGVVFCLAFTVGGDPGAGVGALLVICAYSALLVLGQRVPTLRLLGGAKADERERSVSAEAAAVTAHVLILVILGMCIGAAAQGGDVQPWANLAALGGATFMVATFVLNRRR